MNICMLVYGYSPLNVGGAELQCGLQARELVRQGHTCMVVTARSRKGLARRQSHYGVDICRVSVLQPLLDQVSKWRLFKRKKLQSLNNTFNGVTKQNGPVLRSGYVTTKFNTLLFMVNAGWVIWRRRKNIDVIHTHVASWNAGFAAWLGAKLGIPVVCKAANLPALHEFKSQVFFTEFWKRWRLKSNFIALTDQMKEDLVLQGVSEQSVWILPNGVHIPEDTADVMSSKQVIFVGNFTQGSRHKAFDVLFEAWAFASSKHKGWTLFLAGAGDYEYWETYSRNHGCRTSVTFAGRVEDLSSAYLKSALFVLVSRKEGISNALLEAQSYGLPAVVSDIPGNIAVVEEGKNGFVVPVEDPETTADALGKLMDDDLLRNQMGKHGRERTESCFEISAITARLVKIYHNLKPVAS